LKGYIEERAVDLANYIIDKKTTVRAAAKKFGISKSTVHTVVAFGNGILASCLGLKKYLKIVEINRALAIPGVPSVIGGGAW